MVALGTRQPAYLPPGQAEEESPDLEPSTLVPGPGLAPPLPSTMTLLRVALEVALSGILRFFLLLELKSSRPKEESVDLASSPSSSDSESCASRGR